MGGKSSREEPPKPKEATERTGYTASSNSFAESSLTSTGAVSGEIYETPGTASEFLNQQKLLLDYYKQKVTENKLKRVQEEHQQKLLTEHQQKLKEEWNQQKQQREQLKQKLLEEQCQQKRLEEERQKKLYQQQKLRLEQQRKRLDEERQKKQLEEYQQKLHLEQQRKQLDERQKKQLEEYQQKLLLEQQQKRLDEEHQKKQLQEYQQKLLLEQQQKQLEEQRQQKLLEEEHQKKQLEEYQQKLHLEQQQKQLEEQRQQKLLEEEQKKKLLEEQRQQKLLEEEQQKKLLEEQRKQKCLEKQHLEAFLEEQSKKNPLEKEFQGQIPKKCMKEIIKLYNLAETQVKCRAPVKSRQMSHVVLRDSLTTNWISMPPNKTFIRIALKEDTDEFRTVKSCFKATTQKRFDVVKIERVQNPFTLGCYILKKLEMNSMFGAHNVTEKIVFRGTLARSIDKICENNFNWKLCADRYERGVSFSPISYFASHYSDQKATTKAMFLVRVLTSKIIEGNINMEIPPLVESDNNVLRFDTTKRNKGKIIVKYSDSDFYPEYVIYYTVGPEPEKKRCQRKQPRDDCTVQDG